MSDKQTIEVVLEKHPNMDAAGITIPFDVEKVFGAKRVPVIVTINGAKHRSTIVRMGGKYMVGVPKVFREAAGVSPGDNIVATIEKDTAERTVDAPPDLEKELKKRKALWDAWEKLSYSHKKEHVRAIEEAKRPETRAKRITAAVKMIEARIK
jgi:bifunctional DNA-binding transcriptional regulator/antitoxin component of YhaV-PrlF toxin-antitoxin module